MTGGGHGQSNIDYLKANNIDYNIVRTFENEVRVGNVPSHKSKFKRTGTGQSWFPEDWTDADIDAAGQYLYHSNPDFNNLPDGTVVFGTYK